MADTSLRVVFMGTPEFAIPALELLYETDGVDVVAVYTAADAPSKRGSARFPSPVRVVADELGIMVRTPSSLRDAEVAEQLAALEPDLIVVVAYGQILPREMLDIPRYGCINIHASLLPRWRGAAPIQRALLAGDERLGVSLMRMEEGLDSGAYCAQDSLTLSDELTFDEVQMALARLGARLLIEHLAEIVEGRAVWIGQDEGRVSYAPKVEKSEMLLSPDLSAGDLFARVRASNDSAPARVRIAGKDVRILAAELFCLDPLADDAGTLSDSVRDLAPGHLRFHKNAVILSGADPDYAVLVISDVKPAGGREMAALQWANGLRMTGDLAWE